MKLHIAETVQNQNAVVFPKEITVSTPDSLRIAASFDHMAAEMKDNYRNNDNFISADCLVADFDNDHSDDPVEWKTPDDLADELSDVHFYSVRSRNYMKSKHGKEPRGKWHIYFPCSKTITDFKELKQLHDKLSSLFNYIDKGGAKPAQMTFGVEDPHIEEYAGDMFIDEYLAGIEVEVPEVTKSDKPSLRVPEKIKIHERNEALFHMACSLQSKGLSDKAILAAVRQQNIDSCEVPLSDKEVDQLTKSAIKYEKGSLTIVSRGMPKWRSPKIVYKVDKDGNATDKPIQSIENAAEAIEYDKSLFGRIRFNEIACSPYVYGNLPWKKHKGWREWNNNDDCNLQRYIEHKYGIKDLTRIMTALTSVSGSHTFNPIKDMLEKCYEQWDGNKHVKNLLPAMLGAEQNEYTAEVMRLFMLGAVSRIYHPGIKFDYMLILVGAQGIGKSTFLRLLTVVRDCYNDNFNTLENDKPFEKLRGMWILEMAELLATKRMKDVEAIKSFITSRVDVYRAPYARRSESHPRICVFAGTTNSDEFLTDMTGNRRFLPIACGVNQITVNMFEDTNTAKYEISQAWGEIMSEFYQANNMPKLVLPRTAEKVAASMQERYREADPYESAVRSYLEDTIDVDRVCAVMLWHEALKQPEWQQPQRSDSRRLNDIMKNLDGWNEMNGQQRCGKYGQQKRCFERVQEFIEVGVDEVPFD